MSPRALASEPAIQTPYLDGHDAARYLCYSSRRALYQAIRNDVRNPRNEPIPVCYRGRSLLFRRDELDAWLHRDPIQPRQTNTDKTKKVVSWESR